MTDAVRADLIVVVSGGVYGRGMSDIVKSQEVDGDYTSTRRMRQIASMMFEAAWELEEAADSYERLHGLRVFEDKAGNYWYEVQTDMFYCASDLEEARSLFESGTPHATESTLRKVNNDKLREIK